MNKRQRLLSAAAAATLGLAGLIGAAAPAQAANVVVTVSDSGVSPTSVSATTVTVTNAKTSGGIFVISSSLSRNGNSCANPGACGVSFLQAPQTFDVDPAASGASVTITDSSVNTLGTFTVTYGSGGSSSGSDSSTPAPVTRQFGMPATGTCDEAQPEGLNWSGVANGGWGVSWAQWMNGGNGGAVCTRTLIYSTAQSKWVVN